jgi:hydroxyacylglutathione hydrolase
VLPDPIEDAAVEAVTQLLRIGYDWVPGWVDGGVEGWRAAGRELATYDVTTLADAASASASPAGATILDVRQPREWHSDGVIPNSRQIFVADVASRLDELPRDRPITVVCRTGHRASIGASVLDRAGFDVRLVARGGAPDWPGQLVAPEAAPEAPPEGAATST